MELKEQQEKSRKILEWVGFTESSDWRGALELVSPDGNYRNAPYELNLYSKENLWILFEYVVPRLTTEKQFDILGLLVDEIIAHEWKAEEVALYLVEAITKAIEAMEVK